MASGEVRRLSARRVRAAAAIGIVGTVVLGVGIASAAPGSGGVITACYFKAVGVLRVIDTDAGQKCLKSETKLSWTSGGAVTLPDGSVAGGPGGVVLDESLTKHDLAPDSVEAAELADGAVDAGAMLPGAVSGGPGGTIADGSIGAVDLADGSVGTAKLGDESVVTSKLGDGSVIGDKLADGSVTGDKLGNASITGDKLVDRTIRHDKLADGAVTPDKLTAGAAMGTGGATIIASGAEEAVATAITSATTGHKLLVLGQAQVTCWCSGLVGGPTVRWQVFEGSTPVSQAYQTVLNQTSVEAVATVSALTTPTTTGSHAYELRVSVADDPSSTVTVSKGSLTVVDLGG